MIVQCPNCGVRYKLSEARLSAVGARLKCSRCDQVFPAPSSKKRSTAASKSTSTPDPNLSLPFEGDVWKPVEHRTDEVPTKPSGQLATRAGSGEFLERDDVEAEPELAADNEAAEDEGFEINEGEDTYTLGTAEVESPPPPAPRPTAPKRPAAIAPKASPSRRTLPVRPRLSAADMDRGKVRAILTFLMLTVLAYGGLTGTLLASPDLTDRFVQGIPFIGTTLGGDRLMSRKVSLSDLSGSYQRIKDNKLVFVITGKAFNSAPVALQSVQIAGKLFDNTGQMLDQKTIYCGNVISAKVLKDLTPQMLSILQTLNPPRQFNIEPGGSSTFVIVFMEPPAGAVDFSVQVITAQRQG
ncbi:MAG: zinc-ribbon domain-containing protein [Deltaproteobacteria bacterium]|nr:zinc-ribbon domain-containing protein [Deltaproteobacteria bacterium]